MRPFAEKDLPPALAGEIPREFGELVNMQHLYLNNNQLAGTVRQRQCRFVHNESMAIQLPKVVVAVVAAVQVMLQVPLQVMVQAKICTDALSVSHPPGTGQEAFEVFMNNDVPACNVHV